MFADRLGPVWLFKYDSIVLLLRMLFPHQQQYPMITQDLYIDVGFQEATRSIPENSHH